MEIKMSLNNKTASVKNLPPNLSNKFFVTKQKNALYGIIVFDCPKNNKFLLKFQSQKWQVDF